MINPLRTIGAFFRADYQPWDNFWFTAVPSQSAATYDSALGTGFGYGSREQAMRVGAVYACVGILSEMVATLPLLLKREVDDDVFEEAKTHPLYRCLKRQSNARQTATEWRKLAMNYLLWAGNSYNVLDFDGRGSVIGMYPLPPDRVKVTLLDNGRRGYTYRQNGKPDIVYSADEILHIMAHVSLDNGLTGAGVLEFARETWQLASAQQGFANSTFNQGAEPRSALIRTSQGQPLTDEQKQRIQQSWRERANKVVILEGLDYKPLGMSGRDAQFVENRQLSVADIARFFRVPPVLIGDTTTGASTWGAGIEQLTMGFVNFTLQPWLEAFTQALDRDAIPEESYSAHFDTDELLRGDMLHRFQSYGIAIMNGIYSENEARVREHLPPVPGLWTPRRSANQDRGGDPNGPRQNGNAPTGPAQDQTQDEPPDTGNARVHAIVLEAAARTVRREVAAVRKQADGVGLTHDWIRGFYDKHAKLLSEALLLSADDAGRYCQDHAYVLGESLIGGPVLDVVIPIWEREAPRHLAELALDRPIVVTTLEAAAVAPPAPVIHNHISNPPAQIVFAEGAFKIDARTTVEPATTTIGEGAIQLTTNVEAPKVIFSPVQHPTDKVVTRDAQGRITRVRETPQKD